MIVDAQVLTIRIRHIAIEFFAIQDWKESCDIESIHITGVINPADDLIGPLG